MNNSSRYFLPLEDTSYINAASGEACPQGVTLLDPKICGAILRTYSKLKEDSWDKFEGDTWYLMQSFDAIAAKALQPYPLYERLVEYKIDGLQNIEIQQLL
jgi:hypothetical protein